MTRNDDPGDRTPLSPDEAFSVLGNDTRFEILQTLGEGERPLTFSELRDSVGMRQGGQFNYHLDKVVGHFVRKTDEGYALRQAGRRVVEAVLSGAVTEDPTVEPTQLDSSCLLCGAPIEVSYRQEQVEIYCTECAGLFDDRIRESVSQSKTGHIGGQSLPPAGVHDRTASEMLEAASTWAHLEYLAVANDVCPRCSAVVEHSVIVCEHHDASDDLCASCDRRHAIQLHSQCTNCIYELEGVFLIYLLGIPELRSFVTAHGVDPIVEGVKWGWDWEEEIRSVEPFEARITYTMDGDEIALTVDDSLTVVDITER